MSKTEKELGDRIKSATRLSLDLGLLKMGEKLDIRVVTMLIWQSRDHPEVVEAISEILASEVAKKEVFNGIEFYLPQLAHMIIHLDIEWPKHVLEQFAYMVSQHSLHFALQMHWFVYSSMQDYQPETESGKKNPHASPEIFIRCATLMHGLERAIVYGNVSSKDLEQRYHDGEITKEQLDKLRSLDRLDNAEKITKFLEEEKPAMKGRLLVQAPNVKAIAFAGKKWEELHMEIRFNMLLFHRQNGALTAAIPLHNTKVLDPADESMSPEEAERTKDLNPQNHENYFELHENTEKIYKFRAVNKTQRKKWVRLMRQAAERPPTYEPAAISLDELSEKQVARFNFFRNQLRFAREITDICEEMRQTEPKDARKTALRDAMAKLEFKDIIYNPLCRSSDPFIELKAAVPKDCFPFSTKENCPCLMTFKISKNAQNQDVANVLHDKFNDEAVAGYMDSFSHNFLAPVRSLIARDPASNDYLLIKRPSLWNEEEDITSLSAASNLPTIDDELRFIAKSNDDVRQEVFAMQLLTFLKDVWTKENVEVYLRPFQILATSHNSGLVEFIPKAVSFDKLKKEAFAEHDRNVSLLEGFQETFKNDLEAAQKRFVQSLAGYSVATYVFGIKNRHNGNIMMDAMGRIIHVDFSFILGMAPGKNKIAHADLSPERAAFKLTNEMVEAFGGLKSANYEYFVKLCIEGLKIARQHVDTLATLIEITGYKSALPCFTQPGGVKQIIKELRTRLFIDSTEEQMEKQWRKKIENARQHKGTLLYELFQEKANNIYPLS